MTAHIHLIGIGGTGLSAIARVLLESGYTVSGSDRQMSSLAAGLVSAGACVCIGHDEKNIIGANVVVRSSAVPDHNVEVQAALQRGIPVLKRAEFLGKLTESYRTIAVAGSHGKTTTTAMIGWCLSDLESDPTFIVGGLVSNLNTNARAGKSSLFVIEADEYDHMFLGLAPEIAVITNVEHDHPDCFPTPGDFMQAFRDFADRVQLSGRLLVCRDDANAMQVYTYALEQGKTAITYGFDPASDYQAVDLEPRPGSGYSFAVEHDQQKLVKIELAVPGRHNVQNATAVFAVLHHLGFTPVQIAAALAQFEGAGRRFDIRGMVNEIVVIDDYAHHPTEIRATLQAARQRYPGGRLWVVWQPHTFSRVEMLYEQFTQAFAEADHLVVLDVYAAREQQPPGFSIEQLAADVLANQVTHIASLPEAAAYLERELQPGDVLLTLSAGDATWISEHILSGLPAAA